MRLRMVYVLVGVVAVAGAAVVWRAQRFDPPTVRCQVRVDPGAEPSAIALDFPGVSFVEVERTGDLVLHVGSRALRRHPPAVYQQRRGVRQAVAARFAMRADGGVRLVLGAHDPSLPVLIDLSSE